MPKLRRSGGGRRVALSLPPLAPAALQRPPPPPQPQEVRGRHLPYRHRARCGQPGRTRGVTCGDVSFQVRLCRVRTGVPAAPSSGRCLRNELWARTREEAAARPACFFGTWVRLQPLKRQIGGVGARLETQRVPPACLCTSAPAAAVQPAAVAEEAEEFKVVYRFPGIKYCRVLSRLKLLQTATTLAVLPPVCYLYLQGQVSQTVLLYTTGIAFFAGVMLYGMSYFFRRIIGFIYLSETGRTVRVAHLTFWGRRNDIYCPLETVMTSNEAGDVKGEVLLQFKRYNSKDTLYFTTKYGQVVDRQKFREIFGELQ
ncbi:transmembrane protein 186 [Oxyura jamaicensis]|uniref:transmembrane protein 186 n=1 Tax=Oxyura jamaicensis TaxID=8884 RepID=UPI0015A6494B|nr:transmembrane protein 186 [Oxyura jamaicensis]